jgi:proline iminopeptidase
MLVRSFTALLSARAGAALPGDASAPSSVHPRGGARSGQSVRTGGSQTIRIDGRYQVWLKKVGSGAMPMLVLHGGPGMNHFYFECFEDFLPAAGLSFWYYDQLGCGFSDIPKDNSLWTVERYIEEVEQVRRGLGEARIFLYGHSWGSMLAMEYTARYPERVSALVLSNMTASIASLTEYSEQLIKKLLSPSELDTITRTRAKGDFEDAAYQKVVAKVYSHTLCRLDPWPEPILRSERLMNNEIYTTMCGPDDLNVVGNLKNWDFWDRLHQISAPTLLLGGQYDEMAPEQLKRMSTMIPHSKLVICPDAGHFSMYDNQPAYFDALISFMRTRTAVG